MKKNLKYKLEMHYLEDPQRRKSIPAQNMKNHLAGVSFTYVMERHKLLKMWFIILRASLVMDRHITQEKNFLPAQNVTNYLAGNPFLGLRTEKKSRYLVIDLDIE